MNEKNIFPLQVLACRKSAGLSQKALGDIIGVSDATITMMEKGKRLPSFEVLTALANYFDVPADYLLGRGLFEQWRDIISNKPLVISALNRTLGELPIKFDELTENQLMKLLPALVKKIEFDGCDVSIELLRF